MTDNSNAEVRDDIPETEAQKKKSLKEKVSEKTQKVTNKAADTARQIAAQAQTAKKGAEQVRQKVQEEQRQKALTYYQGQAQQRPQARKATGKASRQGRGIVQPFGMFGQDALNHGTRTGNSIDFSKGSAGDFGALRGFGANRGFGAMESSPFGMNDGRLNFGFSQKKKK